MAETMAPSLELAGVLLRRGLKEGLLLFQLSPRGRRENPSDMQTAYSEKPLAYSVIGNFLNAFTTQNQATCLRFSLLSFV